MNNEIIFFSGPFQSTVKYSGNTMYFDTFHTNLIPVFLLLFLKNFLWQ